MLCAVFFTVSKTTFNQIREYTLKNLLVVSGDVVLGDSVELGVVTTGKRNNCSKLFTLIKMLNLTTCSSQWSCYWDIIGFFEI